MIDLGPEGERALCYNLGGEEDLVLPTGPPWTTKHSDEAQLKTTAIPRRQDQQVLRPLSHGGEGSSLAKNLNQPSP